MVQRRPKDPAEEKAPNVAFVVLVSAFGYPGAGHLMLGKKALAAGFAVLFTAGTVGIIYEIAYLVPIAFSYLQGTPLPLDRAPNWPRMVLWIVLTSGVWALCAIHSGVLARQCEKTPRETTSQMTTPAPDPQSEVL